MAETVLDSLVVRIRADLGQLEQGLAVAERGLGGLGESALTAGKAARNLSGLSAEASGHMERSASQAARRMGDAFARMARQGEVSFTSLKNTALAALAEIAAGAVQSGLQAIFSGGRPDISSIFLPQRAGGGAVHRGQPYLVGERGPELFVPAATGRIAPRGEGGFGEGAARGPRIWITINQGTAPAGGGQGAEARRSAAQIAVALRRAMMRAERAL